ncbi:MAG: glycosyltransferase family 9 protein [Candidatus Baltobacteraceae bacterium]
MSSRAALVLLLPGLGDALAASPILRGLSRAGWAIDAMTMHAPVSEYVRALGVRDVYELPLRPTVMDTLRPVLGLRSQRYHLCVLPFPATRWQYTCIARGVGARRLATHEYGGLSSLIARTGGSARVALRGGHRIAENLRLARELQLEPSGDELDYWVPQSWRADRIAGTLGVHPGSMAYKGNESKRWPYERFVALARQQAERGRRVRFFLGPHETTEATRAEKDFGGVAGISIIRKPLAEAARRLAECEVFVGNDAGFSHLASGLGVKTLAIFGMTSEVRGVPVGPCVAFRPSLCPACHDEGSRGFDCVRRLEYRCILQDVEFEAVSKHVEDLFEASLVQQHLSLEGPFRLYGKAYS